MFFTSAFINRSLPAYFSTPNRYGFAPNGYSDHALNDDCATHSHGLSIESQADATHLSLDIPGFAREHLTIGVEGQLLRISAKDDAPRSFQASYKLRHEIDAASSEAKLEHGVLSLKLGKFATQSKETLLSIQ